MIYDETGNTFTPTKHIGLFPHSFTTPTNLTTERERRKKAQAELSEVKMEKLKGPKRTFAVVEHDFLNRYTTYIFSSQVVFKAPMQLNLSCAKVKSLKCST